MTGLMSDNIQFEKPDLGEFLRFGVTEGLE